MVGEGNQHYGDGNPNNYSGVRHNDCGVRHNGGGVRHIDSGIQHIGAIDEKKDKSKSLASLHKLIISSSSIISKFIISNCLIFNLIKFEQRCHLVQVFKEQVERLKEKRQTLSGEKERETACIDGSDNDVETELFIGPSKCRARRI
ncbi:hypothetical protein RDI58_007386 [Solanum bulbocastanum]|uniref:Uncharacterized protein n=1 Tax=Solanum bulbocastanum TaxID=147425 RepID=A0AAN8YM33_SOLBU